MTVRRQTLAPAQAGRRHALATLGALFAASSASGLLVACGGGGDASPGAMGGASAAAYVSGPISGLGSIIVGGTRFDDSAARVEDDGSLIVVTERGEVAARFGTLVRQI